MRIAFLTNIVSPYRLPVFRRLAATPGWTVRVLVNGASEFDRRWTVETDGIDVRTMRGLSWRRRVMSTVPVPFEQTITLHVPISLWHDLSRFRPDVVISHELGPRSAIAAAWARAHGVPLVLWAYQSRVSATQGHGRRAWLRRSLLRRAGAVVGMGTQARAVLESWGVESERIVDAANAADHDTIHARLADPALDDRAEAIRRDHADGRRMAIVVGRLVPLKGTSAMLEAWSRLPAATRDRWRLVFLGDGPLAPLVRAAGDESVHAAGHVPVDEMAAWYRASALQVFPTLGDVWGLVVNEAAHCGVPTLCSTHAGCCDDLVLDGRTGLAFDPTDPSDFDRALQAALSDVDLPALGEAARRHASDFTLDRLADGFRRAARRVHAGSAA